MLYVHCTLMDESRQCLTCLLLLTPIMFPDGNHFTFQSLLFSVFAKLLFAHSTRISSAVIIVVLLLGVTDFYPKFTFVLSLGGITERDGLMCCTAPNIRQIYKTCFFSSILWL